MLNILYSDAVSKCSRIEQSGQPDRIHLSKETAELIKAGGQGAWVRPRHMIGNTLGETETFWLLPKRAVKNLGTSFSMLDHSTPSHLSRSARRDSQNMDSCLFDFSRKSRRSRKHTRRDSVAMEPLVDFSAVSHQSGRNTRRDSLTMEPLVDFSAVSHQSRKHTRRDSLTYQSGRRTRRDSRNMEPRTNDSGSLIGNAPKDGVIDSSQNTMQTRKSITRRKRKSSLLMVPVARQSQSTVDKIERLVFWSAQTLLQVLQEVVARRRASKKWPLAEDTMSALESEIGETKSVLRELRKPIVFSGFGIDVKKVDSEGINLGEKVESQLIDYVTTISSLFMGTNPYSNVSQCPAKR